MIRPNILVTGASGYLGSNILKTLAKNNDYKLTALDIESNPNLLESIHFIKTDINDIELLYKAFEGIDLICHCASLGGTKHGLNYYNEDQIRNTNVKGTQNLYNQAKRKGVKKIVLTSSIDILSQKQRKERWPIDETIICKPEIPYGISKNSQETTAKLFADDNSIKTIALRSCAFFPLDDPEQGFRLTGNHAMVGDIVNAHIAAIKVLLDEKKSAELKNFEAIFITNKLPYKENDKRLIDSNGNMKKLIQKYWPLHSNYLFDLGCKKSFLAGVYDLNKAKKILNWEPALNFDQWLLKLKEKKLNFEYIIKENKRKKSLKYKTQRFFLKMKKKLRIK
jgi:nucleoside-diphosphate-sugar epimerase|tara:strand:- start:385 stop:1395 length:1011 start_codon:yes stop_codon:yes gene_type:complete